MVPVVHEAKRVQDRRVHYKNDAPGRQLTWQNLGLGAFLSMASREARSLGLVLMAESTVTPVPTPNTNVPMSSAALRPWGIHETPNGSRFLPTSAVRVVCGGEGGECGMLGA